MAAVNSKPAQEEKLAISRGDTLREDLVGCPNLIVTLQRAAERKSGGIIHVQPDGPQTEQSYLWLWTEAKRVLAGLRRLGLKPGDKVLLQFDFTGDFVLAFWGAMLGGIVPVPLSIAPSYEQLNSTLQKLQNAWHLLDQPLVLTSEKLAPALGKLPQLLSMENFRVETLESLRAHSPEEKLHDAKPSDLALMMLTSGSTGVPKAVMLSHRNVLARSAGTVQMNGFSAGDISLSWMPMDHVASVIYFHLRDVFTGAQQIHAPAPWILQDPLRWLDLLSRFHVSVTFAPNFAYSLVNERAEEVARRDWDLSSVRFFLNGGESIVPRTARRFLQLLMPHGLRADAMRPAWGMSETCSGVTYGDRFSLASTSDSDPFVEVGLPIPGVSLRIVDASGETLREGEVGNLEITGEPIMAGYYRNPEFNAQVFSKDGWFKTGDLGLLRNGHLTITGRQKEVIIINGVNYYSHEIEAIVEELEGVETSYTAACAVRDSEAGTEKMAVFFSVAETFDTGHLVELRRKIRAQIVRAFGINPHYVIPLAKKEIPKTEIGKIQRSKLRERFEAREFHPAITREEPAKKAWCGGRPLQIAGSEPRTLTEALVRTATQSGNKQIIFVGLDGSETTLRYDELFTGAKKLLTGLRLKGLKRGDYLILQIESAREHLLAFWGAVLGGIIPVTIATPPAFSPTHRVVKKVYQTWQLLGGPPIIAGPTLLSPWRRLAETLSMQGAKIFSIDAERYEPAENTFRPAPEDVLFLQLTSGSTGAPKCIQETHRGIVRHIASSKEFLGYTSKDVTLNWLPFDHVVPMLMFHLKDVYLGCQQIQVKTDVVVNDPLRWLDLIENHAVTHTWAPNFGFKLVTDALAKHAQNSWDLSSIKFFINAGEQVTMPVVRDFLQALAPFGLNEKTMCPAFGMAEVCTCMTYKTQFDLERGARRFRKSSLAGALEETTDSGPAVAEFVSCGATVAGVEIRIASQKNELLPEGVIGRLQIKGDVVTPGYLNNEAANRDAFVENGWFNSGDLGFILDDELFLTGREKEMIIIRGSHFYCYEIEETVNRVDGVEPTFAAACAVEDRTSGSEGLAIFFVPTASAEPEKLAPLIRAKVAACIGITPSHIVPLEKKDFPKTTSGKIQRTQLKKYFQSGEISSVAAEVGGKNEQGGNAEEQVRSIWQEVLRNPEISGSDSFFEMGGDSLRAFQIMARVREQFQVELPPGALFDEASTVSGMARWIQTHSRNSGPRVALAPVSRGQKLLLSFSQQRIWLLEQLAAGSSLYNVSRGLWLTGPINARALEQSINAIIERHEILRTFFVLDEGAPVQKILPEVKLSLPCVVLQETQGTARTVKAEELAGADAAQPFDLTCPPLVRVKLFRVSDTEHLLLLAFHQIVIDGWSLGIFFEELAHFYDCFCYGKKNSLPPLPVQYADFALWRRHSLPHEQVDQALTFWKKELAGPLPVLQIPTDHPRPDTETHQGDAEPLLIGPEFAAELRTFSRQEGATLFMTMLAAWKILLRHYSNEEDILVGSPVAGRNRVEVEKLIGFFVSTIVLRTRVASNLTFRQLLARVRDGALGAFANAHLPFEKIVEELQPERTTAQSPFFQVWFGFIDTLPEFTMGEVRAASRKLPESNAQFDLSLFVVEKKENALCLLEYKTDLFEPATIRKFLANYELILREAITCPDIPLPDLFEKIRTADEQRMAFAAQQMSRNLRASLRQTQRKTVHLTN